MFLNVPFTLASTRTSPLPFRLVHAPLCRQSCVQLLFFSLVSEYFLFCLRYCQSPAASDMWGQLFETTLQYVHFTNLFTAYVIYTST